MKGRILSGLVITLALLVITFVAVWACTKPSQPQCPPGTIEVMPAVWTEGECSCPTDLVFNGWYWQGWHLRYFTVTFDYGKSNDPNKCHRPTASSLNIPSSLRNEFNREFDEWVNASCTDGYWTDPVCRAPVVTHDVDCEGVRELSEGVFVKYVFHWQYAYILETTVVNDIQYNEPVECLQDMPEGCTNPIALNYDKNALVDDGTCILPNEGCTDPKALNFNPEANVDDGTCEYTQPAAPAGFDIGCRPGESWPLVTPLFGEGIVSIEIVGVAIYYPPTGQAVKLGPGSYQYSILLADGFDADFPLSGSFVMPFCPVAERTPLPGTSW